MSKTCDCKSSVTLLKAVVAVCLFFCILAGCESGASSLTLVQDGQPKASILLAEKPNISAQLAAHELQYYVKKITGATLPIVKEPGKAQGVTILIGPSKAAEALGLKNTDFEQTEYLIETRPNTLILMGLDTTRDIELDYEGNFVKEFINLYAPMGSCYAVHTFLERFLDVRWYLPTDIGEVVREKKTIVVPQTKIRRKTHASETSSPSAVNQRLYVTDFLARGKELDYDRDFDQRTAILYAIRNKRFGSVYLGANHSFHGWDKAFGKDHPEWFSTQSWEKMQEIIAENPGWGYQLKINPVLSNEALIKKQVEIIRGYLDGKPEPFPGAYWSASGQRFGISINDNGNVSQLPECVKQYEPEMGSRGNISRYFWGYVNRVAREVGKTHPEAEIIGLAYMAYSEPPKGEFKLEPNVSVMVCRFPILYWEPEYKKNDLEEIETWIRHGAKHIYTWEYLVWPDYIHVPAVLPQTYTNDAKWLVSHPQYKGGYIQMLSDKISSKDGNRSGYAWLDPQYNFFNFYFRLKLYDDPSLDPEQMFSEFYDRFYGPAGGAVRLFVDAMQNRWNDRQMRKESGFGAYVGIPAKFYFEHMATQEFVDKMQKLMESAKKAAPEDSVYARRVDLLDKGILQVLIKNRARYLLNKETPKEE